MKEIVNASELFLELTGLEGFIEYNISVRAYTSQGPGPFSDDITQMTQEDGMFGPFVDDFYDHFKYIAQTARSNLNARVFIYYLEKLTTRFYLTYMITFSLI